jgi:outer membrane protein W
MRRLSIVLAILLVSTAAAADDHLTVFINNLGHVDSTQAVYDVTGQPVSRNVSEWTGGGGLSLDHAWNARWSTEASVGFEQRYNTHGIFVPVSSGGNAPATVRDKIDTYPIDLMMRFRFPNESRWTPYIAAGAHYAGAPDITYFQRTNSIFPGPVTLARYSDRFGAQIGAGTTFRITPRVGLQLDLKQQLRTHEVFFDPLVRGSFGVNWKF